MISTDLPAENSIRSSFHFVESKELKITRIEKKKYLLINVTHYLNTNNIASLVTF